jgi:hypothetical protein
MNGVKQWLLGPAVGLTCALFLACDADGVGDPCTPEEEYSPTFSGFALSEVSTRQSFPGPRELPLWPEQRPGFGAGRLSFAWQ